MSGGDTAARSLDFGAGLEPLDEFGSPLDGFGGEGDHWPDPDYFLETRPPVDAPLVLSRTLLGRIARQGASAWGAPELLWVMCGLGVAVAATAGRGSVRLDSGAEFPLSLYLAPVAPPGGLKSPTLARLARPLVNAQAATVDEFAPTLEAARDNERALAEARDRLRKDLARELAKGGATDAVRASLDDIGGRLRDLAASGQLDRPDPVMVGADTTYEYLIRRAAESGGRVAVLTAEGGLIENLIGRYHDGGAKTEFFNSAYDREPFDGSRISDTARTMTDPWASLLITAQPDVLAAVIESPVMRRRGFLQRILPASCQGSGYRPRSTLDQIEAGPATEWDRSVARVWARAQRDPFSLPVTGPAADALHRFEVETVAPAFEQAESTDDQLMCGFTGKLAMTTHRVAAVIELIDNPEAEAVGEVAARAAAEFGSLVIEHARWLYSNRRAGADPALRVLGWLAAHETHTTHTTSERSRSGAGSVGSVGFVREATTREVHYRFRDQSWCETAEDARRVLSQLRDLGWLEGPTAVTGQQGGRPSERWQIHPRAANHLATMHAQAKAVTR